MVRTDHLAVKRKREREIQSWGRERRKRKRRRRVVEILLKLTAAINKINLFHYVNQTRFTDYKDDL